MGIPADKSATLLMFIGVFATLGRLGGGFLCNLKLFQARILLQASLLIMGTSVMLLSLAKTYGTLVAFAIVFSASDGMMMVTFLVECMNSVEDSKQASAVGFSMISAGVVALGAPPLTGVCLSLYPFLNPFDLPALSKDERLKNLQARLYKLSVSLPTKYQRNYLILLGN